MGNTLGDPIRPVATAISEARLWRSAGVAALAFDTMGANFAGIDAHVRALEQFKNGLVD